MINTIKKVMIVVAVLMNSCHVPENLNIGPVIPHKITMLQAIINAAGLPEAFVTLVAILSKNKENRMCFLFIFSISFVL